MMRILDPKDWLGVFVEPNHEEKLENMNIATMSLISLQNSVHCYGLTDIFIHISSSVESILPTSYSSTESPLFFISSTKNRHSPSLTLLTLILVNFNICIFSSGCPFSACHSFNSLSVTGALSFCLNVTWTTDHFGSEGFDDGS